MRTINMFGRKMPIIAILMALLVIGTASAAVFIHYATLSGTVEVTNDISVDDIEIDGSGTLVFTDYSASFTINNDGDEPVIVELDTSLYFTQELVINHEGLSVDYSVINDYDNSHDNIEIGSVLVPPGGLTVDVEFDATGNTIPGTYEIMVFVSYTDEDYEDFGGNNAIETLMLTHKDGNWDPTGQGLSEIHYVPMGNLFCYEMDVTTDDGLLPDTDYALIYYADKPGRFENWGGDNPGFVINIMTTDEDGEISIRDAIEMDMDMPHPNDANYDTDEYCEEFGQCDGGAKLWIIPTTNLTSGTDLPMSGWDMSLYLFETELIHYTDTNA